MESPLKKYKELSNINNIKDLSYDNLFTKYIIRNDKAEEKLWEIDSTDQESLMRARNGGYPFPGFIYTFIYLPEKTNIVKIVENGKEHEYIDYVPIVFCTRINGIESFKGINLNILPNLERVKFLEMYWRSYDKFFKNIEQKTQNNKLALNEKFISMMLSPGAEPILETMGRAANANFKYGFRQYSMKKIKQFRMIEYTEWDYIPFYEPKNAFKGMNQKHIHDLYYKTRQNI